jgi:hypothetical protein
VRQLAGGLGMLACPGFSARVGTYSGYRDLNNVNYIFAQISGREAAGWWGLVLWHVALSSLF